MSLCYVRKLLLIIVALGALLSSCGGICGPANNNSSIINLQIDYVGTVPVLNGNQTSSYFYIHNDGTTTVDNISYTLADAVVSGGEDVTDANGFKIHADSITQCASIPAGGFCEMHFTTPSLTLGNQNNSLFKVLVRDKNENLHEFHQVINYSYYNIQLNNGVNFATSADVVANITNKRYMIGYLVAGGVAGKTYSDVEMLISDLNLLSINQGFINGEAMASGELVPVEFKVNVLSSQPTPMSVTPQYVEDPIVGYVSNTLKEVISSGQSLYLSSSSQTQSVLALKLGVIPIVKAPTAEADAPTIYVSNFGGDISGITIEPTGANVVIYSSTCGNGIRSNSSCKFKIGIVGSASGSDELNFKLNGRTILTDIVYYAPDPAGNDVVLVSNAPVSEIGLNPNQTSSVINLVFTNLGDYSLTDLVFNPKNTNGSASTSLEIIENTCADVIVSKTQCVVRVRVIGGSPNESGGVYLDVNGKSQGSEFGPISSEIMNYYVTNGNKLQIIDPIGSESTLSISGNGVESAQSVFTIKNVGDTATIINAISITGVKVPSQLTQTNNCPNTLAVGATCQVIISYGPVFNNNGIINGVANLVVNYANNANSLYGIINYTATSMNISLVITNVVTSGGFATGTGTESDPYNGSGCDNNLLQMTITYKNLSESLDAINMSLDIIDNISPYLSVDDGLSTCGYGANAKTLAKGASCNLVLNADRSKMDSNSDYNLSITYPSASWTISYNNSFMEQDNFIYGNSPRLYANYSQPTLVSQMNYESGASMNNRVVVLTQTLTGSKQSCGSFNTAIGVIPNVESVISATGNCTVNGNLSINCVNTTDEYNNQIVYKLSDTVPLPVTVPLNFTKISGNNIWYDPSILLFNFNPLNQ